METGLFLHRQEFEIHLRFCALVYSGDMLSAAELNGCLHTFKIPEKEIEVEYEDSIEIKKGKT